MPARITAIFLCACALGCDGELGVPEDAGPRRDASVSDAAVDAAMPDAGRILPSGPVLYAAGARHSPITEDMAAALREVASRAPSARGDVLAKVGDSITADPRFLGCLAGTNVDLDGRPLDATIAHFLAGDAGGTDPFTRDSIAAEIGWSASAALAGAPSPLTQELDAIAPRYAVVMYGTNDVGFRDEEAYARDMIDITDVILSYGAIPILSSIPPRDDEITADARVPLFNLAVRAIAQGRGVPFVDFHRELAMLADHGLDGDGVHPRAYSSGACIFTADGLAHGVNVRNLITLEALDRARRALAGEALDADAPRLAGSGASASPFEIELWPFAVLGDTRRGARERAMYSGCSATQDESGPEELYRFVLDAPARVTITVLSARGVDADVHVLDASATEGGCIARADRTVTLDLAAGTYYVAADTFVGTAGELAGEYLLLAVRE